MNIKVAQKKLSAFAGFLRKNDKADGTVRKYTGEAKVFLKWCRLHGIRRINMSVMERYREYIQTFRLPAGCNTALISLHRFFLFACPRKAPRLKTALFPVQKKASCDSVFTRGEFEKLLRLAKESGEERCYFLMRILAASGMRISELAFVTRDSLSHGSCVVRNKRKTREVFIPRALCKELSEYCDRNGISGGLVFCGKKGKNILLNKSTIWRDLHRMGCQADFLPPGLSLHAHTFRHFFAKEFMERYKDLSDLADILGHSSVETTRIYTRTTSREKHSRIDALDREYVPDGISAPQGNT